MNLPLENWRSSWENEKVLIRKLPFIASSPIIGPVKFDFGVFLCVAIDIKVDMPTRGSVCDVKSVETPVIALPISFPEKPPFVLIRHNFPSVPHLGSRKDKYRTMCLTRQNKHDWWQGKTFGDLLKDIYDWLCDAAAGKLIKDDDPFEPLIASGSVPVEINTKEVQQECAKYDGLWTTIATAIPVKDGQGYLIKLSRSGEIPTQVWYQSTEQSELWIDPPDDVEELLDMAKRAGFDSQRIRYWIERGKTHLLIIFGIRRPKEVLGRLTSEEWVAFELKRKKPPGKNVWRAPKDCRWQISTHLILDSFNMEMASTTSGFQNKQKNVLLIGAGAIGSEIAEALTRSGTVKLTIIDNDCLRPHNLARHTLSSSDLGEYKATALTKKINSLFSYEVCTPITKDFFDMTFDEFNELTKEVDMVVNCSASVAVQSRLSDILRKNLPAISCFQINKGIGTVLIFSPNIQTASLDMCETMLITGGRDYPLVINWLSESDNVVSIGGGCSAITSKIPGSIVKFGAGWLADRTLRLLNCDRSHENAFIEILEYNYESDGVIKNYAVNIEKSETTTYGDWTIVLNHSVVEKINQLAKSAFPNETGGIMIGRLDKQRKVALITDAWKAPKDSESTQVGFSRGLAGLKSKIALLEDYSKNNLTYVGEWHSHSPDCSTKLSSVDSQTAERMAKELTEDRIPAICLISNTTSYDTHVVENN
jgi:molybdopterin/thiamine biosynthesis adenylyltransferase/proteasome lid subunit RPN8/RPN11